MSKLVLFDRQFLKAGYRRIAGVDEVGRGALAGPVVAAACVLSKGVVIPGANDSKQLSRGQREAVYEKMVEHKGVEFAVGVVEASKIDEINIVEATRLAMRSALDGLERAPDYLLVDGAPLDYCAIPGVGIVRGDALSQVIALASIAAKVTRDALMREYHKSFPEYQFDRHVGYPTSLHCDALKRWGVTPIHRRSYAPVREVIACQSC